MNKIKRFSGVLLVLSLIFALVGPIPVHAATAPDLGAAASYAVFGKAGVTNNSSVGTTHVWGNVGADATNVTNLDDATQVDGVIDVGAGVQAAILSAYTALDTWSADGGGLDLAGTHSVTPGVYTVGATTLNGNLTLNGAGVYIFRSSSSISADPGALVTLINGADACNVFWQVPGAFAIGGGAHIKGTILTSTSFVSLGVDTNLEGRALSRTAAVTLNNSQITNPVCLPPPPSGPPLPTNSTLPLPLINVTKIPTPLNLPAGPGAVTYDYTVTNIGIVPMSSVIVADDKCSNMTYLSGDTNNDSNLDLLETWKYRCTTTLSLTTINTVTATGMFNGFRATDTAYATVVVGVAIIPPLIHMVKVPNIFVLPNGGGAVTYTYSVTNPGTVGLSDVYITDDKCTGLPGRVSGHPGDLNHNDLLESNETWQFTCQTNLTQSTTNTGTVYGTANGIIAVDYALASVVVSPPVVVPTVPPPATPKLPNTGIAPD